MTPIRTDPRMLTPSVAHGNPGPIRRIDPTEARYRAEAPIAPPRATCASVMNMARLSRAAPVLSSWRRGAQVSSDMPRMGCPAVLARASLAKNTDFDEAPMTDPQSLLRGLFDRAVQVADPMQSLHRALPPRPEGRLVIVGAGKASARMAEAAEAVYGPCEGLVITRYDHGRPCIGVEIAEAAHPVPDAAGQRATARMLGLLEGLGESDLVLALISGGGSALLTAPAGD